MSKTEFVNNFKMVMAGATGDVTLVLSMDSLGFVEGKEECQMHSHEIGTFLLDYKTTVHLQEQLASLIEGFKKSDSNES